MVHGLFEEKGQENSTIKKYGHVLAVLLVSLSLLAVSCTVAKQNAQQPSQDSFQQSADVVSQNSVQKNASSEIVIEDKKPVQQQTGEKIAQLIADGTYTKDVGYNYHSGHETITISVTVKDDVVTDASITSHNPNMMGPNMVSARYIGGVRDALPDLVIGKKIDQITIPRQVSGSSLTSGALRAYLQSLIAK